jgi:hypothetical protein
MLPSEPTYLVTPCSVVDCIPTFRRNTPQHFNHQDSETSYPHHSIDLQMLIKLQSRKAATDASSPSDMAPLDKLTAVQPVDDELNPNTHYGPVWRLFDHLKLNSVFVLGKSRLEIGFGPTKLSVEWVKLAKAIRASMHWGSMLIQLPADRACRDSRVGGQVTPHFLP